MSLYFKTLKNLFWLMFLLKSQKYWLLFIDLFDFKPFLTRRSWQAVHVTSIPGFTSTSVFLSHYSMVNSSWLLPWNFNCHSNSYCKALQYRSLLLACVRISEQFKVRLNVVERWVCIHNQYLYTSSIYQKAYQIRHKYHEIIMHLVLFHGSVNNGMIPNLIEIKNTSPWVIPLKLGKSVLPDACEGQLSPTWQNFSENYLVK